MPPKGDGNLLALVLQLAWRRPRPWVCTNNGSILSNDLFRTWSLMEEHYSLVRNQYTLSSGTAGCQGKSRETRIENQRETESTWLRESICMFVPMRERRRESARWMMKRERETESRYVFSPISPYTCVFFLLLLSLCTLSVYVALRPTPRFQLH